MIALLTPIVQTQSVHMSVSVLMDSLEMGLIALVRVACVLKFCLKERF